MATNNASGFPDKGTLLIVDDEAVNLRLLSDILSENYRVIVATSGEQALKLISKNANIEVILLDLDMPIMSGYEVLNKLKLQPTTWEIPVILVTGRDQEGDEAFGLEQGAADYLSKPISAAVVKARVRTQMMLAKSQDVLTKRNEALAHALSEAESAKNELSELTAMVSHELRTPIAVLQCETELLVDGVREPDQKNLNSLLDEVKHFSNLINDLFDLVLSEGHRLKYFKEPAALDQLIHRCVELFKWQFDNNDIDLQVDTDAISGMNVLADPRRIRQVIDNILKNTLKYTDPKGKLNMYTELKDNMLWVHFQDTVPGVAESSMTKLFDRFYRVEKSRNRATGGAGLGLSICKTIIADHAGKITVKDSPLGGLWLSIGLPAFN